MSGKVEEGGVKVGQSACRVCVCVAGVGVVVGSGGGCWRWTEDDMSVFEVIDAEGLAWRYSHGM